MTKLIYTIFTIIFCVGCAPKGKYSGSIVLSWDNMSSRGQDSMIIRERLNKLGINHYTIDILNENEIKIDFKQIKDTSLLIDMMIYNEKISFWECYQNNEAIPILNELSKSLAVNGFKIEKNYFNPLRDDSVFNADIAKDPVWTILEYPIINESDEKQVLIPGPIVGYCKSRDKIFVDSMLSFGYNTNIPKDMTFSWSNDPIYDSTYSLIALKKNIQTGSSFITETSIMDWWQDDSDGLTMKFNEKGSELFASYTKKNIGKSIAIMFDNKVLSYPTVEDEIKNGLVKITSNENSSTCKKIDYGLRMIPYKSKPRIISHRFY